MPETKEIPYEVMREKLLNVPKENREAAVLDLKKAGYTWTVPGEAEGPKMSSAGQPIYPPQPEESKAKLALEAVTAPWSEQIGAAARAIPETLPVASPAISALNASGVNADKIQGAVKTVEDTVKSVPGVLGQIPYAGRVLKPASEFVGAGIPESPGGAIASYLGGKAVSAAAPYISNIPIVKSAGERLGQQASAVIQKAKSLGIPLSISDITQSPTWAKIESTLAKTPFGADAMEKFRQKQIESAKIALEKMADKYGPTKELYQMGESLKNAIAQNSLAKSQKAKELYDVVGNMIPGEKYVATPTMKKMADSLLQQMSRLPKTMQDQEVKGLLSELSNFDGHSWEAVNAIRSKMMEEIANNDAAVSMGLKGLKFQSNPTAGVFKRLVGPLESDMHAFGEKTGGQVNDALQLARTFYKGSKERFSSDTIKSLVKRNPEDVAQFVLRPNNITEIYQTRKAVGPVAFNNVKRAFFDKVLTAGKGGEFSPDAVSNVLSKFGDGTLKEIFTNPDELKGIKEFASVMQKLGTANKMSGNPSGTAQNVITYGSGALTALHPVTGAIVSFTPKMMSRILTSDSMRNLFLTGLRTPSIHPSAARIAGQLIGLAAAKGIENKMAGEREKLEAKK